MIVDSTGEDKLLLADRIAAISATHDRDCVPELLPITLQKWNLPDSLRFNKARFEALGRTNFLEAF